MSAQPAKPPRMRTPRPPPKRAPAPDQFPETAAENAAATEAVGSPSLTGVVREVGATFTQLRALGRSGRNLAVELAKVANGSSAITPAKKDWRFQDPSWTENSGYRRISQSYLAGCAFIDELLDERDSGGHDTMTARFALNLITSAVAPTNTLLGNPAAIKRALETNGRSLVRGARNWADVLRGTTGACRPRRTGPRSRWGAAWPRRRVESSIATPAARCCSTPRSPSRSASGRCSSCPPPIGRFYFLDLRPGRSFVEYAVGRGLQTFMLSWRNPTKEQGDWDLDAYAGRVLSAVDTVREVTGSPDVNVIGFCAGGIINSGVLNHLAATGDDRIHTASFAVTLLDFGQRPSRRSSSHRSCCRSLARWNSARAGVISARDMGAVFTLMRPNDLVWNYWVNNYLMGKTPPVFDILAWNADGTNLPAALHRQFLDMFETNSLCHPGSMNVLGTPVDLATIKVPTFVTGAMTDHLTPWKGCYRTTQLLSGPTTFVLSNTGHIQSLVNPPGNPKASFFAGPEPGPDPHAWLAAAEQQPGTWWPHWADWVVERSGAEVAAPPEAGSELHPPREPAPGLYVLDQVAG